MTAIPATVEIQDLTLQGGDGRPLKLTVRDLAGAIVDISGATEIRWAMAASPAGPALVTKTKTGGHITFETDGADGIFVWTQLPADTVGLAAGKYYHEAEVTLAGLPVTVAKGTITLEDSLLD